MSAINDILLSSVATYLKCGGVVNNRNKKGLLLSLSVKNKIVEYLVKFQARLGLSRGLCVPGHQSAKSARNYPLVWASIGTLSMTTRRWERRPNDPMVILLFCLRFCV